MRALSKIFRGKLHQALRHLNCYGRILAKIWKQGWVVHCEPVGSGLGYGLFSPGLRKPLAVLRQQLNPTTEPILSPLENPDDNLQSDSRQTKIASTTHILQCPICGCPRCSQALLSLLPDFRRHEERECEGMASG